MILLKSVGIRSEPEDLLSWNGQIAAKTSKKVFLRVWKERQLFKNGILVEKANKVFSPSQECFVLVFESSEIYCLQGSEWVSGFLDHIFSPKLSGCHFWMSAAVWISWAVFLHHSLCSVHTAFRISMRASYHSHLTALNEGLFKDTPSALCILFLQAQDERWVLIEPTVMGFSCAYSWWFGLLPYKVQSW